MALESSGKVALANLLLKEALDSSSTAIYQNALWR
jgi:hypothetical protein